MLKLEPKSVEAMRPVYATLIDQLKPLPLKREGLALGLWGEPGIGKSYTVTELLRETPYRTLSLHVTVPLSELTRALPSPAKPPAWAESLLRRLERGEHVENEKAASALSALLGGLAPVILHLEDLHEASPERLDLVGRLAAMVKRTKGVALLVTSRVVPPEPFAVFRLEPLDAAGVYRLLEGEAGASLPAEALDWIYTQAAGNPLFTLEFFRHLARRGFLWNDGRKWRWRPPPTADVPLTVEALIERLVGEAILEAGVRAALEARAILPVEVSATLWAEVTGLSRERLEAAHLELQRRGLMRGGKFAHPLFREVTLNLMPSLQRQGLARRTLEALRAGEPQAAAAYVEAAGLEREPALELLRRAAEQAKQAGNEAQAARWMARAVEYARGEERGKLALEAAQVLQHHDLPEAARLVKLALPTPAATPETVRFYAHLLARQGRMPDLEALLRELPQSLREAVNLPALSISTYHIGGKNAQALEIWEAHPELHADPSPELLRAVAGSALATGQTEKAQILVTQGLSTTDPLAHPTLRCEFLSTQALIHYHRGEYAAAEATLAEVLEILAPLDVPRLRGTALVNRAAFLRMLGRYGEMSNCLEEALQIRRQVGDANAYAFAQAALAEVLIEQGRYEAAEEALSEAIATLELYGPSRSLTATHSMANLLYRSQDTPIAKLLALRHAEQALGYARQMGNPRLLREVLLDAAFAQIRAGYPERALALTAEAEGVAEAAGNSPHDTLQTLWARGLALGALGEAAALGALQQALKLARELHLGVDQHKVGLELDRLNGDLESARRRMEWFAERGLMNGVNLAVRLFPQLAEHSRPAAHRLEPPATGPRLEVLGPLQFSGEPLRGHKRQELLALLLEARVAGKTEVGKLELLDRLYPGEDEKKAASSLKELIRTVRSNLGASAVVTTPSGYALGVTVSSDLEEFLRTGDPSLWRGAYLEGLSSLHETVRESVHLALRTRAQALLEADPKEAARLGRILLEADPYDPQALRLTLLALRGSKNHKSLARLYEEAREWMLEVGEQLPIGWMEYLNAEVQG
jgi:tetratricopeptide (TPR) repeat protein